MGFGAVVLALGSMGMAIGATAAVLHPGDAAGQLSGGAAVADRADLDRDRGRQCRLRPVPAVMPLMCGVVCGARLWRPGHVVACAHEQRPRGGDPRFGGRARRPRSRLRRRGGRGAGRAHRGGDRQADRRAAARRSTTGLRAGCRDAQPGGRPVRRPAPPGAGAWPRPATSRYQGYQGYLGPVLPPGYQLGPPPARPPQVGARNVATTDHRARVHGPGRRGHRDRVAPAASAGGASRHLGR